MKQAKLNEVVPDFSFTATNGVSGKLSDYLGKTVVLYFYPKDNTPGCTLEGNDFRTTYDQFTAHNTVIFGISRDSLKSHEKFKAQECFPFELIDDNDEALCTLFDVMKMKNMYGKSVRGVERSTFIIDSNGTLIAEWRKVSVPGHVAEVLQAIVGMP
jgi:thioredoxin-dependent peroxiredoxin